MYQVGEMIIYGGEGVCQVKAIGPAPIQAADQTKTYYTLSPCYHNGVIYAPTDVNVPMRPVLSKQAAWELINSIPEMAAAVGPAVGARQAAVEYKALLQTYEHANLLRIIRMIYAKHKLAITQGKSYGQIDERFFKRAKELLHGELAIALGVPLSRVEDLIGQTAAQRRPG